MADTLEGNGCYLGLGPNMDKSWITKLSLSAAGLAKMTNKQKVVGVLSGYLFTSRHNFTTRLGNALHRPSSGWGRTQ